MRSDLEGVDVLVVEDEHDIRDLVVQILTLEGANTRHAANGKLGIKACAQHLPDVVLLDMRMPVLDGWGFVREAREKGWIYPIVVMTAAENAQAWAKEVGAAAFVSKPFDIEELLQAVCSVAPAGNLPAKTS